MSARMNTPLADDVPTEHFDLGPCSKYWDYRDIDGSVVMRVCRWEQPGGKKDIRPVIRVPGGWAWKHHPDPRPLYQLDRLAQNPDAPVIVVEGEKAAEAAQKLFPEHIVTTWPGGASSMGKADWSSVLGRAVILIPDCDTPGRKAMEWVRTKLQWLGDCFPDKACQVRLFDPVSRDASLPEGWDMADAVTEGRDVSGWLMEHPKRQAPGEGKISARPFIWRDPKTIPPRQWLYGKHYMRGMVTATAGIGGAGKSTLLLVEAISMAIGRDLLRDGEALPVGPVPVWVHNGEDPYEELERRVAAILLFYKIQPEELGDRLRLTSGRDMPIMVAQEMSGGGKLLVGTPAIQEVIAEIKAHGIQAFIADPFVTLHRVNENDNGLINDVMILLRDAAHESGCAIELAHHFRKLNGDSPTVDSMRGASSIVGAARSARIVAGMTADEATKYGIAEDQRGFYSWLQNGKANMLPPTHRRSWLHMESVSLENACHPHDADQIGVAASWAPPETDFSLNGPDFRMIRRAVMDADPLVHLRADPRAIGWIGAIIAKVIGLDLADASVKLQVKGIVARLVANGSLVKSTLRDHAQGRAAPVLMWKQEETPQ